MNTYLAAIITMFIVGTSQNCCLNNRKNQTAADTYFDKIEQQEINYLLFFFEKSIQKKTKEGGPIAYKKYNNSLISVESNQDFLNKLLFTPSSVNNLLDTILNFKIFSEIWEYTENNQSKFDTTRNLFYNINGKYFKYLKKIAKCENLINEYSTQIKETGGMLSPSLMGGFPRAMKNKEFSSQDLKVFCAIHYLSINLDYYLSSKLISPREKRTAPR